MLKTAISYAVINKSLVGWTIEFPILTSNTMFFPNINFEDGDCKIVCVRMNDSLN